MTITTLYCAAYKFLIYKKKLRPKMFHPMNSSGVVQYEEEVTDSEGMASEGADSEDDLDDYDPMYLQTFYNKINENKEYFYEQLLAKNKNEYKIKPKKKSKSPINSQK